MSETAIFRSYFDYDPDTGVLTLRQDLRNGWKAGRSVGSVMRDGYVSINFQGKRYMAHRVAWLLVEGEWPNGPLDHKNLNKSDNRWSNLRLATPSENNANWRGRGALPKGVTLHRSGRYQAQIRKAYKSYYLGLFSSQEEASSAYAAAARKLYGEFARVK